MDLLGLHSINNRVQSRRDGYIEVGKQDENIARNSMPKAMSEDGEEGGCVKHEDDTDVGAAGAQGLFLGTLGWELKDSMEDEDIGNSDEDDI